MSSETKTVRSKKIDVILLVAVWLVAFLINGVNQLLQAGFDFSIIRTSEFWYDLFSSIFTNILIFVSTLFYLVRRARETDNRIIDREAEIVNLSDKHVDPNSFDLFLPLFNRDRKKVIYRHNIRKKLNKLEKKNRKNMKSRLLWTRYMEDPENEEISAEVDRDAYCSAKRELRNKLKPENVEKVIDDIYVKFKEIDKQFVTNGYDKHNPSGDLYHVESSFFKLFWDLLPRVMMTVALIFGIHTVFIQPQEHDRALMVVLSILLAILPLLLQVLMAVDYKDRWIKEKILSELSMRRDIILKYLNFKKKRQAKESETNGRQDRALQPRET